jgi:N-methylhydantoinase A/oxoprolinase/acetone carboxylase beta subunit
LLNPKTRQVILSTKTLTTHHDLKVCIGQVLDELVPDDPDTISFISLSTTLATNAIAEGKRRQVGLFLLGYDPDLIYRYQFQNQFGTSQFFFINGRHDMNGNEQIALDEDKLRTKIMEIKDVVDAFAISSYAGPRNSSHELRAAEIINQVSSAPVVQAHHLSSDLDSIRRATTASLNASLLSNLHEFLNAVQDMLRKKGIRAPLLMVRGDGSIIKTEYARSRPVEIIHSGPATSTIGGQFLAGVDDALIIDIGGTTTDIALVSQGKAQILEKAATVGNHRTCVKTIRTRSIGLGGDSCIHFDRQGELVIGPDRMLPLSHFCIQYPNVRNDLISYLQEKGTVHYADEIEYWILRQEPRRPFRDERTNRALEILKEGPVRLRKLMKLVSAPSPVLLDKSELINQEIIQRAGLTPTDLLHVNGEFSPWDTEIAHSVIDHVARNWDKTKLEFIHKVQSVITRRIVAEIIQFFTDRHLSEPAYYSRDSSLDRWFFEESLSQANPYLSCNVFLKVPLVGIGAPANAYLPSVAAALGTQIILPEHYAVANAVGTVVGSVLVRQEADVFPCVVGHSITGYFARVDSRQVKFNSFEEAVDYSRQVLTDAILQAARLAGSSDPHIEIIETDSTHSMMHLSAWGTGKPTLG